MDIPVCFLKVDNNLTADLIAKYREKGLKAYGEVSTTAENMRHINTDQDNLLVSSARPVCKSSGVGKTLIPMFSPQNKLCSLTVVRICRHTNLRKLSLFRCENLEIL